MSWRPAPRGTYEALPPSPRCFEKAAKAEAAIQQNPKSGKYVPPGMRNASPGATSAATASLNSLRNDSGAAAVVGRVQPGAAAGSGSSVKAAPAPAKPQRQLLVGEVPDEEEEPAPRDAAKAKREAKKERQRKEAEEAARKAAEEAAGARKPEYAADAYSTDPAAVEKRLKKLRHKLRQIDQLKTKDRAALAPEQRAKLDEEASVLRLVAELEALLPKAGK